MTESRLWRGEGDGLPWSEWVRDRPAGFWIRGAPTRAGRADHVTGTEFKVREKDPT